MKILVTEDEEDIRNLLVIQLEQQGYAVAAAKDGLEALGILEKEDIDLAELDVMMPRLDGFNLLRNIRQTSKIPVIFLTARGEEMDKLLGLGLVPMITWLSPLVWRSCWPELVPSFEGTWNTLLKRRRPLLKQRAAGYA